jgi:hypothetical protein
VRSPSCLRPLTPAEPVQRVVPVAVVRREARLHDSAGDTTCQGCEQVIVGQQVAVGAEQAADGVGGLSLLGDGAYRTEIAGTQNWLICTRQPFVSSA